MKQLFTIVASYKRYYTRNQPTNQRMPVLALRMGLNVLLNRIV